MSQVSVPGGQATYYGNRPRYAYRITFSGVVCITTDPIEVARLRRAYPAALVEIIPVG